MQRQTCSRVTTGAAFLLCLEGGATVDSGQLSRPWPAFAGDTAASDFGGRQGMRLRQAGAACQRRCQQSLLCTGARQAAGSGWARCRLEFLQRPTVHIPGGQGAFRGQQTGSQNSFTGGRRPKRRRCFSRRCSLLSPLHTRRPLRRGIPWAQDRWSSAMSSLGDLGFLHLSAGRPPSHRSRPHPSPDACRVPDNSEVPTHSSGSNSSLPPPHTPAAPAVSPTQRTPLSPMPLHDPKARETALDLLHARSPAPQGAHLVRTRPHVQSSRCSHRRPPARVVRPLSAVSSALNGSERYMGVRRQALGSMPATEQMLRGISLATVCCPTSLI